MSVAARIERGLAAAPAAIAAREALAGAGEEAWIVGGAVRDAALGRAVGDLDLVIGSDPEAAARRIAADGHAFELSGEFATWRALDRGHGWSTDVATLRGGSIEADLKLRDFTLNAVAVPLAGGQPLDPTGGLDDLRAGLLRAASQRAFEDDPLRLLRAARLAAGLGLSIDAATAELARRAASRAAEPAGERQFAELRGILSGPDPLGGLDLLDRLGVTAAVLPELEALRGVSQSANHHLDAHAHTIEVLRRLLEVEADLERFAGESAPAVADALAEPLADELTRGGALRFAAILHDVGKPATRSEQDGFVGFRGHDRVGAEIVREICRRLRTSRRFADQLAAITRHHLVLGFMVRDRPLPPRRVWQYLRETSPVALDVTVLTIADRLSAQGGAVPEEAIEGHLELAREMLAAAIALEREGAPRPPLDGTEIAAVLGIEPGPELGEAVDELAAATYAGEVGDRESAAAHLRRWRSGG